MPVITKSLVGGVLRVAAVFAIAACGSAGESGAGIDGGAVGFTGSGGPGAGGNALTDGGDDSSPGAGHPGGEGGAGPSAEAGGGVEGGVQPDGSTGLEGGASDAGSSLGVTVGGIGGVFISLDWTIAGPAGTYSGTVNVGDAGSVEFVAGGVAEGDGYTVTMSGIDVDGLRCAGTSAPFRVVAGSVTSVSLQIACPHPADSGIPVVVVAGASQGGSP